MKILIDLSGLKTEEEVLRKWGDVFNFGGADEKGWGLNWDAFNDCLRELEDGGIWGTSKKFTFPLEIEIANYKEFKNADAKEFDIMKDILQYQMEEYSKQHKMLKIHYS